MYLLSGLFVLFICVVAFSFVVAELSKRNAKPRMKHIDNESLEYRQMFIDKINEVGKHNDQKPKSNLRGVKKRYSKVPTIK